MEGWGTRFWVVLRAALLAAGWIALRHTDALTHAGTGCSVRLLTGRCVRFTRPGRAGQELLTSRKQDHDAAALEVAAAVHERVALRMQTPGESP